MKASHSKNCGKGLARLEMMVISKLNLCNADNKNKGLARHVQNLTVIWRLGMAEIKKADIK